MNPRVKELEYTGTYIKIPQYYGEGFEQLQFLSINKSSIVDYRGNIYSVSINKSYPEGGTFQFFGMPENYLYSSRFRVSIWDLVSNRIIGSAGITGGPEFIENFAFVLPDAEALDKIKSEIKAAICRTNMKPTDFYK